jgi:UTP--glucose-1-phosphate uridylyltransferase
MYNHQKQIRERIMIKKAIITAAGKGTRQYPGTNAVQKELFPLIDRDGLAKPTIQIIVEEAMNAGIEDIAIIVQPGGEKQFQTHFQGLSDSEKKSFHNKPWGLQQSKLLDKMQNAITYIHQTEQHGFGHAVYCAHEWAGDDPVLLMLGDHVYLSHVDLSCAQQLVNLYDRFHKSIFAVQQTHIDELYLFGTVAGEQIDSRLGLYMLNHILEKPTPAQARATLVIPDLPPKMFLTIFGLYLLTPTIFQILGEHVEKNIRDNGEIQLTTALAELIEREGAVGYEIAGERLDMGTPLGYLHTQAKLAQHGVLADEFNAIVK